MLCVVAMVAIRVGVIVVIRVGGVIVVAVMVLL
jgi:hypothetical protein